MNEPTKEEHHIDDALYASPVEINEDPYQHIGVWVGHIEGAPEIIFTPESVQGLVDFARQQGWSIK